MSESSSKGSRIRRIVAGAAIVLIFLASLWRFDAPQAFGAMHDDSLLVVAAKSLAVGEGYRIASWPGAIAQTKYPPAYPAAVAALWKLWPDFPGNIRRIYDFNALCGLAFVAGCWAWLRSKTPSPRVAWVLTAICAAHPTLGYLGSAALTDVPFAALVVWAAVLGERALAGPERNRSALWAVACLLAAVAVLTRTVGLALVIGLALAWLRSAAPRPSPIALLPPLAALGWWLHFSLSGAADAPADAPAGYVQSLEYYQSYGQFWLRSMASWDVFSLIVARNLASFFREPAKVCFQVPTPDDMPWLGVVETGLTIWLFFGMARRYRTSGATALDWALLPTAGVVVLWNYQIMWRFLLPFLPLFLLAASDHGMRIASMVGRARRAKDPLERAFAHGYVVALVVIVALCFHGYVTRPYSQYSGVWDFHERLQPSRAELYSWVRSSTPPDTVFAASNDGLLHLHTGRFGARPIALTTDAVYGEGLDSAERQLTGLADTADALGADFWIRAPDDYGLEAAKTRPLLLERTDELLSGREVVFESSDGLVRVFRWGAAAIAAPPR